MVTIGWIIGLVLGIGLGIIATKIKSKCNHVWKLFESGDIRSGGRLIGNYKFYECERCKKMRKETIGL